MNALPANSENMGNLFSSVSLFSFSVSVSFVSDGMITTFHSCSVAGTSETTAETTAPAPTNDTYDRKHFANDLFIGDSMVEGLRYRLSQYATANGHSMECVIWYSSSSKYWAKSDTLSHFIRKFDPTYIFLCMGANELFVRNLEERDAAVGEIIREIGDLPLIWIGPPNWKPDTGINDILLQHCGKKRYYPSLRLQYQRAKDGAHPVLSSYNMWADSVSVWLRDSSAHPIRWDIPEKDTPKTHGVTILSPPKD